jgi:hypothetical protein
MHTLDVLLRTVIQTAVMGVWGLLGLAFLAGLTGRAIRWLWNKLHRVTVVVHLPANRIIDAEWVPDP